MKRKQDEVEAEQGMTSVETMGSNSRNGSSGTLWRRFQS